jgi:hypothetical protein
MIKENLATWKQKLHTVEPLSIIFEGTVKKGKCRKMTVVGKH